MYLKPSKKSAYTVIVQPNINPVTKEYQCMVIDDKGNCIVDAQGNILNQNAVYNIPSQVYDGNGNIINTTPSTSKTQTAGIQEAIQYTYNLGGGKIYIKRGTYNANNPIIIGQASVPNVGYVGSSNPVLLEIDADPYTTIQTPFISASVPSITTFQNFPLPQQYVKMRNIIFKTNYATYIGMTPTNETNGYFAQNWINIAQFYGFRVTLENVHFISYTQNNIDTFDVWRIGQLIVRNSSFRNYWYWLNPQKYDYGCYSFGIDGVGDALIENSEFIAPCGMGIGSDTPNGNIILRNFYLIADTQVKGVSGGPISFYPTSYFPVFTNFEFSNGVVISIGDDQNAPYSTSMYNNHALFEVGSYQPGNVKIRNVVGATVYSNNPPWFISVPGNQGDNNIDIENIVTQPITFVSGDGTKFVASIIPLFIAGISSMNGTLNVKIENAKVLGYQANTNYSQLLNAPLILIAIGGNGISYYTASFKITIRNLEVFLGGNNANVYAIALQQTYPSLPSLAQWPPDSEIVIENAFRQLRKYKITRQLYQALISASSNGLVNLIPLTGAIGPNTYDYVDSSSPSISANPPASGTVYQNLNPYDIYLIIPVTLSPTSSASASAQLLVGDSSSSLSVADEVTAPAGSISGQVYALKAKIPAGYYYKLELTNATAGTATVLPTD